MLVTGRVLGLPKNTLLEYFSTRFAVSAIIPPLCRIMLLNILFKSTAGSDEFPGKKGLESDSESGLGINIEQSTGI